MGPRGPGKPEKLVGGIQDQGQMERWGEGGDGCDAGRRVIQVEGVHLLKAEGSRLTCDLEFQRASPLARSQEGGWPHFGMFRM